MDTGEILKSLQQWLRADKEKAGRANTPAGEGPPSEGAGGDQHETNHPKGPDAVQRGLLARLSTALVLLPAQGWVAGCHWKWRRSAGDGNNCLATERDVARWCSCGGIV
jgi:hypothetical protein